ncbi:GH116 family glycosyl-hydrolase [Cohnella nanjingensis]|uniref:Beta-glucosidase n=1 Tax=Cohnella nanjingensis TaxID=1387779 RepID=A0A7X0RWC8_9BACL|nr:GH116 family glycosyl-hydrolase [Cohnella nanjingensis]MBB6674863.1 hypothetical protein [Cohnella nanjingensis]
MTTSRRFVYEGYKSKEISFPLGGIGSGCVGLAGNGRLIDWEIFNKPNKLSHNGFSFFAVKAEAQGVVKLTKVLHGDLQTPYTGEGKGKFEGYGYGPKRENMTGFPHFANTSFKGEYPFAEIAFDDAGDPISVKLTAFNPLIPLNAKDSSLPAAVLTYAVTNRSAEPLDVSVVGNLTNPAKRGAINSYFDEAGYRGFKLRSNAYAEEEAAYGDLTLATDCEDVSYQSYWYRGGWFDNAVVFWQAFTAPGRFKERHYDDVSELGEDARQWRDVCLLSGHRTLAPGETGKFTFILSWSYPNYVNDWNPGKGKENGPYPSWKNYYATQFGDSKETAGYLFAELPRLERETRAFKDLLFGSTLPHEVVDAVSANISILKSPTVLRLPDGSLYGFEGVHTNEGSCEGSCTHVWGYEQVTPFLFPELARSMRDNHYRHAQFDNGKVAFRLMLPPERTREENKFHAAADGQMADIVKTYREWRISGDTDWLRGIWPQVKKSLEYAWDPTNDDWWDRDRDGVMEGVQHHTLDEEAYGPNAFLSGMYHSALLAASVMAEALGDGAAGEYRELYERGRRWVRDHLFNGEYFTQQVDLKDERFDVDPELGEIKYQFGEACHIDQVLGQWHAHVVGLGYVFDRDQTRAAVSAIYKYNFIPVLRDYTNACRIYGLNDERGLLIATYPKGGAPKVPVPYADECMNGFEYQAASHMIYEGLVEEGLAVVRAIRHRYDGERRNPWNEFECGSNYVRSMASYSLLTALSGFEYDQAQEGLIGFSPVVNREAFKTFWSLGRGWGEFAHANGQLRLSVAYGELTVGRFRSDLLAGQTAAAVVVNGRPVVCEREGNDLVFAERVRLAAGDTLTVEAR